MADPLERYNAKRDFTRTAEPAGTLEPGKGNSFIVQKHDATRLHWDLRMERDGVLRSWALPRGLPWNPKENRLAVATDDHSLDFLDHEPVVKHYYGECVEIVKQATGAAYVFAFDHNVRSAQGKRGGRRISGGQQVQGPAHVVHGDYTLTSAPQRLADLTRPPGGNDTLRPHLADGESLIEPEVLIARRSYTYDETQVLGKEREETILRQSLAEDLARQVVRRIEALTVAQAPG